MASVHQGQKKERSMRRVNPEAEEDADGEDGSGEDQIEEEGVKEEESLSPAIHNKEKVGAEEVEVENLIGWNIDQSYEKHLERRTRGIRNS